MLAGGWPARMGWVNPEPHTPAAIGVK